MRIINNLIFLLALLGSFIFAAVNWPYMLTYTHVYLFFGTVKLPLNLITLTTCLGIIFLQWLIAQGSWILRNKKLERAEKEIVQLKAKLYDLTDGSLLDEIKESITETRKELREDIRWLASGPHYNASAQLGESQHPPLLKKGGK